MSLCACSGTYAQIDLKAPVEIPESGIIEKEVFDKIRDENAIAVFTGYSSDLYYEWTVFESDIVQTRDVNMSVLLEESDKSVKISLCDSENFGFPAFLSVHVSEKWDEQSATVYKNNTPVCSASITGSKTSILNLSVTDVFNDCVILPDVCFSETVILSEKQEKSVEQPAVETVENSSSNTVQDSYLSEVKNENSNVYSDDSSQTQSSNKTQIAEQNNEQDSYLSNVENKENEVVSNEENIVQENTDAESEQNTEADSYLSDAQNGENDIYSNIATEHESSNSESNEQNSAQDSYLSEVNNDQNNVYVNNSGAVGSSQNPSGNYSQSFGQDSYLSGISGGANRVYSNGQSTEKDQYLTDPVPAGKPLPVEPENQEIDKGKTYTCTFSIECSTILNNLDKLDPDKRELVPSNGVILAPTVVTFYEGESVYDVLLRVCREKGIHIEYSWTPIYNSAYIEGIHNLYEFDCGDLSGWMYRVNGWYPNYGCSRYQLVDGETVEWRYTCDLGADVGRDMRG